MARLDAKEDLNKQWVKATFKGGRWSNQTKKSMLFLDFTTEGHGNMRVSGRIFNPIRLSEYNIIRKGLGLSTVSNESEMDIPLTNEIFQPEYSEWNVTAEVLIETNENGFYNVKEYRSLNGKQTDTPY